MHRLEITPEKKATRPERIRKGDRVRVVNPEFFVRCGYPKCLDGESKVVLEKFGGVINGMIWEDASASVRLRDGHLLTKVCRELAYARLKASGFGGQERTIHTKRIDDLAGREFVVCGVKFCKTGTYVHGGSCGEYGEEYDPPYLDGEKTHKILSLAYPAKNPPGNGFFMSFEANLSIEAANVEKASLGPD